MYFNSRPSARGDAEKNIRKPLDNVFQFTPLREGRPDTSPSTERRRYFNSRPSARGDCSASLAESPSRISIHAPPRGATTPANSGTLSMFYFNSRPSARGDALPQSISVKHLHISIHAPPRGATSVVTPLRVAQIFQFTPLREGRLNSSPSSTASTVFQFTPLREGRRLFGHPPSCHTYFNSRPSARGDPRRAHHFGVDGKISIHAPPRGATALLPIPVAAIQISIHAPPRGATSASAHTRSGDSNFNSRPSARGDCHIAPNPAVYANFNSRPSARGDPARITRLKPALLISIHAPPRGATIQAYPKSDFPAFQFTPLREGRRCFFGNLIHFENFNSRPSARGDKK